MRKYRVRIGIIIAALCLIIAMVSYAYVIQGRPQPKKTEVSIIVHGDNAERWENFRQGIEQAAADLNASISFVVMSDDVNADKQISLLKKEQSNGAQGIIISAFDSVKMAQTIVETAASIPVVMAETSVFLEEEQKLEYVSADNEVMGGKLAEMIMENSSSQSPVYILKVNEQRDSVIEREERLTAVLQENGYTIGYWTPEEGDFNLSLFVEKMIGQAGEGIVAALDETTLESVIDGVQGFNKQVERSGGDTSKMPQIYGIGSTAKIVYHLNQGSLEGIVFQDEYHMGYTSMVRLLRMISAQEDPGAEGQSIESYTANRQNLHLPEIERLLYPIIQ